MTPATEWRKLAEELDRTEHGLSREFPSEWKMDPLAPLLVKTADALRTAALQWEDLHPLTTCPRCGGKKYIPHDHSLYKCIPETCEGSKCEDCGGEGRVRSRL